MKKATYVRLLIIALIAALLSGGISAVTAAAQEERQTRENLISLCKTAVYQYDISADAAVLSQVLGGNRVTIVSPDGVVLDDSWGHPEDMENHLNRKEIKGAREGYVATTSRQSVSLGQPFMYAATKLANGNILRLAQGYGGIVQGIWGQLPVFLVTLLIAAIAAVLIARAFTRRILKPLEDFADRMSAGQYDAIQPNCGYYELDKITGRIHDLLSQLSDSQRQIVAQHEKTSFILSNMNEGFILLDDAQNIVLINSRAEQTFHVMQPVENKSILALTRNQQLQSAIQDAVEKQVSSIFDWKTDDTVYSVHASPVSGEYVDSTKNGATVLLIDVGAERSSQQQRSEFFSNASHELKTPITTISAMSEMLENGLLEDEGKKQIYTRIHTEAKRMNSLITDILTISKLESGMTTESVDFVNLCETTEDVLQSLAPLAEAEQISLSLDCDDCHIYANRKRIRELLINLTENAVKYNRKGGQVDVSIKKKASQIEIDVSDTGIGIPYEAQSRIFERFYRVDSGRSRDIGGTGLGLAIVKHIARSLGGKIDLKSKPGEGTRITVTLPGTSPLTK